MQPNQELDIVLNYLAELSSTIPPTKTAPEIIQDMKKIAPEINSTDIYMILGKLQRDKYVESARDTHIDKRQYNIIFEGKVFSKSGGYAEQAKRENINLMLDQWTTFALIFGGVSAGIYYTAYILAWLVNHVC